MAEWSKAHAWKVCIRQRIEGSNPSLSAIIRGAFQFELCENVEKTARQTWGIRGIWMKYSSQIMVNPSIFGVRSIKTRIWSISSFGTEEIRKPLCAFFTRS